jgi:Ca-activated chloride channel family protein
VGSVSFGLPELLWLLVVPGALALLWFWRFSRYRRDVRRFRKRRQLPVRERLPFVGGLLFWLCAIAAAALTIVALARPQARVSLLRSAGVDVVILQDGSASMHVTDVAGDRWQRSMRFLRVIAESLRWKDDRVALALFAHIAAPQIRLTRDPNTLFFFLDHLDKVSPFPLEDDTTWDTNIEAGIYWGTRLFEKDEQLWGKSPNGKVFVLISDGQAWSGQVANALRVAQARGIPVFVVGVGTAAGGPIPEPPPKPGVRPPLIPPPPIHATLDRASLLAIAQAGAGEYFELDRDDDHDIANRVIDAGRRRAGTTGLEYNTQDLYWQFLLAAACVLGIGVLFLQERVELALSSVAAVATLGLLWAVIR